MFFCRLTCFLLNFRLKLSIIYIYDTLLILWWVIFLYLLHISQFYLSCSWFVLPVIVVILCFAMFYQFFPHCLNYYFYLFIYLFHFELLLLKHHLVYPRFLERILYGNILFSASLCLSSKDASGTQENRWIIVSQQDGVLSSTFPFFSEWISYQCVSWLMEGTWYFLSLQIVCGQIKSMDLKYIAENLIYYWTSITLVI